jgi:hypothetical protein
LSQKDGVGLVEVGDTMTVGIEMHGKDTPIYRLMEALCGLFHVS